MDVVGSGEAQVAREPGAGGERLDREPHLVAAAGVLAFAVVSSRVVAVEVVGVGVLLHLHQVEHRLLGGDPGHQSGLGGLWHDLAHFEAAVDQGRPGCAAEHPDGWDEVAEPGSSAAGQRVPAALVAGAAVAERVGRRQAEQSFQLEGASEQLLSDAP